MINTTTFAGAQQAEVVGGLALTEKFFGCVAGSHVGAAMGAPTQNWPYDRIEKEYGTLDRLLSYNKGWQRDPGTTDDCTERQKLMITAIIEKQDRVTAEDIKRAWVRDVKAEAEPMLFEPFERPLFAMARSGIPGRDIGKYCDFSGLNTLASSCFPIGLINAGDVRSAVEDVLEVGQLYQTTASRGIQWGTVTAAAIAAACEPGATVDAVLAAITKYGAQGATRELNRSLRATAECKDFRELRKAFDKLYSSQGPPYAWLYAPEVVSKGVCIFRMVKGNVKDAIIAAANIGRDTASVGAIAGGLSGALSGAASIPEAWIQAVERATSVNTYTNSRRTMKQHSDGLLTAFQSRLGKMKAHYEKMANA
ncbi:MAG TPA: ADP-ribosylglycohydrolase family protein [Bryobacteraceae bacterium]|nr:ADP-ribosylglycohydrolase family protein [Bryobacteraceae bacterium]